MIFFELEPSDISNLNDADLRELVARLCEAELIRQEIQTSCVLVFFTAGHYYSACLFSVMAFALTFTVPRKSIILDA